MKKNLLITAFCAGLATPSFAQETTEDTVVAIVDGEEITVTHVLDIHRQLPDEYRNLPNDVLFQGILDQLVQQRVLAASLGATPTWLDAAIENERASLLAGRAVADISAVEVAEADIQAAYEARFAALGDEFNASHILVATEEEALALVTQLEGGAEFAALAQEFSTGPSGPRGGELGWFGAGMMVAPFEEAVAALETGGISGPVQTQFGWHVIKLNETRPVTPPPLDDVRGDLEGQIRSERLQARMAELLDAEDVTRIPGINPDVLTELNIFGQ